MSVEVVKDGTAVAWSAQDIVERIMTSHWDMAACPCWVCRQGRLIGLAPLERWLRHKEYPVPSSDKWEEK